MEALLGVSLALFVMSFFWGIAATKRGLQTEAENVRLQKRVVDLQLAGAMAMDVLKMLEKQKPASPQFDQQTISLIKLAVVNTNENESRSAAVQVCKRLYKQIK